MFDSTEMRNRPAKVAPYRQPEPFAEVLTSMVAGARVRFWVASEKMQQGGKAMPGMPQGQLFYELELIQIDKGVEPPVTPPDVAKPAAGGKKTERGVCYKWCKS